MVIVPFTVTSPINRAPPGLFRIKLFRMTAGRSRGDPLEPPMEILEEVPPVRLPEDFVMGLPFLTPSMPTYTPKLGCAGAFEPKSSTVLKMRTASKIRPTVI